jgi:uncharacterized protein (DUF58 family)
MSASGLGLTTRATCLLAAGGTAVLCGLLLGEVDLVRAGVLALVVPVLAALAVNRSRVQIANRREVSPQHASSGDSVLIQLTITNRSRLRTGALMLEDQLPARLPGHARFVLDGLASREARAVSYRLTDLPRGRYRAGPLRVRLTDPFHLVDVRRAFTATTDFVVRPLMDPLPALTPPLSHDIGDNSGSHSIGTHGADDASTREYRTGDALRKIHWRSSARTGSLMVRQEERPWQGQATLLLDLRESAHVTAGGDLATGEPDERRRSSLEWAVSAAASIGAHLITSGRSTELICDLSASRRLHPDGALGLIEYLATVRALREASLMPARNLITASSRESALIAVLGEVDPASLRVLADCHARGSAVPAVAFLLDTRTWAGSPPSAPDSAVRTAARVLTSAGWRVVVAGRDTALPDAWREVLSVQPTGALR